MRTFDLVSTAQQGLRRNLGRSFLTILGIIIGVAAIVLVMSLGKGARQLILSQVQGVGGDTIVVRPGREPKGPSDVAESLLSDSLKQGDVTALLQKSNAPDVKSVVPAMLVPGSVSHQNEVFRATVFGWQAEALEDIFQLTPIEGDFFTDDDIRAHARVAVIGDRVKNELFPNEDPLGKFLKMKKMGFRIVGVLPKSGQLSFLNPDELVVIPYTTAQKDVLGVNHFHEFLVRAESPAVVQAAAEEIKQTLRERHNITDPKKDDFFVVTQEDLVQRISSITQILTIFLSAIAAISLVVGGVGIMNIMLVSVTERTREIGLRKSVGATNSDILRQFLLEALMLTVSGGIAGTLIALTIASLIAFVARTQFAINWPLQFPLSAILLGVGMAGVVGLLFGIYPARQAARKSPIEALRYE